MTPKSPILHRFLAALLAFGATSDYASAFHGTISVTQTATTSAGTQLEFQLGSSPNISVSNPPNPNFGDYFLEFPGGEGVNQGTLITSVAKNGEQNGKFVTTAAANGLAGDPNQLFIAVTDSQPGNSILEANSDAAFAFFDYTDWFSGTLINPTNGNSMMTFKGSSSLTFGPQGQISELGPGQFKLDLTGFTGSSSQETILLVNGAANDDNYALSQANADGTFNIFCRNNGVNGTPLAQGPVSFVQLNRNDILIRNNGLVAMGRIRGDGGKQLEGGILFSAEPMGSGQWLLKIRDQTEDTGTLLVSPEGGELFNTDNILSYQWDDSRGGWIIQSRDITSDARRPLQSNPDAEPVFSFAFFEVKPITVTTLDDEDDPDPLDTPNDISLREAIKAAPENITIRFDPNLNGKTISLNLGQLTIGKNLAIDASGLASGITIDAQQRSRVIQIQENASVTLHGLTLTGGRINNLPIPASLGGAIYNDRATLHLSACTLSGNSASSGGAIHSNGIGGSATLSMNACTLSDNSADSNGGGIFSTGAGEGFSNGIGGSATLSMTACFLSGNSADRNGGGIYNNGFDGRATLSMSACTLSGNSADRDGGGIFSDSRLGNVTLSMSACTLSSNSAGDGFGGNGGGIYTDNNDGNATLSLSSCTLSANSADSDGGGIYFAGRGVNSNTTLSLSSCTLSGNSAKNDSNSGNGGGIYSENDDGNMTLSLSACTLSGNSTNSDGGGIYFAGRGVNSNTTLSLNSCTLSSNSADDGGGIFVDGSGEDGKATLSLSDCTLSGNFAEDDGGGIHSTGGEDGSVTTSLRNCTLSENSANDDGGGINSDGDERGSATLSVIACTLSGNSAVGRGGGIFSDGDVDGSATLSLSDTILAGNLASSAPDLSLSGAGATATGTGNNLMAESSNSTLDGSSVTFTSNPRLAPLGDYGGPTQTMHPLAGSPAILTTGNITRTDQRGFTFNGPSTIGAVKLGLVTTVSNEAELRTALNDQTNTRGQVIRFANVPDNTINLASDQLEIPSTANGIFLDASDLPDGLTIDANGTAAAPRRVMQITQGATAALHSLTITGGHARGGDEGGGITVGGDCSVTLTACTISGNRTGDAISGSGGNGGGIATGRSSYVTLTACTISGNQTGNGFEASGGSGGGIFVFDDSSLTISHSTIAGNIAAGNGGGILSRTPGVVLTASIVAENIGSRGNDIEQFGQSSGRVTTGPHSYVGDLNGFTATDPPLTGGNIGLAPLGDYGGPTQTMIPLPGSPAIDPTTSITRAADQRGFPITDGSPDIGAAEFQGDSDIQVAIPNIFDIDQRRRRQHLRRRIRPRHRPLHPRRQQPRQLPLQSQSQRHRSAQPRLQPRRCRHRPMDHRTLSRFKDLDSDPR